MTQTSSTTEPVHIDIDHLAKLSRLELDPGEKAELASQLDSIAAFMSDIQSVDTSSVAMAASLHRNVFVPDEVTEASGAKTAQLIAQSAPQSSGDFLTVPQVITAGKHS
jgi:aspartyl-tRNA(Asn)/glutamyl-tRNA(Gln) amidotransferase subunit C